MKCILRKPSKIFVVCMHGLYQVSLQHFAKNFLLSCFLSKSVSYVRFVNFIASLLLCSYKNFS